MKTTIDTEFYIEWVGKFRGINDSYRSHSIHSISYPSGTELNRNIGIYLKEHPDMVLYDKIMQQKIKFEFNNKPFDLVIVEETIVIEEIDELKAAKEKGIMIKLNCKEQREILKTLKEMCIDYKKYRDLATYSHLDNDTEYERIVYRGACDKIRKHLIYILASFELPLLESLWYSRLKSRIKEIVNL